MEIPGTNQMQFSSKRKTIFLFFMAFLKYTSNFENFEAKDQPQNLSISEINDSDNLVDLNG